MKISKTIKIMAMLIMSYFILWIPVLLSPSYLDSPLGFIVTMPYFSLYLLNGMGVPYLLQNNGLCGWGWCSPSLFGWLILVIIWLIITWLIARIIAIVTTLIR